MFGFRLPFPTSVSSVREPTPGTPAASGFRKPARGEPVTHPPDGRVDVLLFGVEGDLCPILFLQPCVGKAVVTGVHGPIGRIGDLPIGRTVRCVGVRTRAEAEGKRRAEVAVDLDPPIIGRLRLLWLAGRGSGFGTAFVGDGRFRRGGAGARLRGCGLLRGLVVVVGNGLVCWCRLGRLAIGSPLRSGEGRNRQNRHSRDQARS